MSGQMDGYVGGWVGRQVNTEAGRWTERPWVPEGSAGGSPLPSPGTHLPAEVHLVQQLDPQQDADLVEFLGHIQVLLQVPLHQGIQHPPVNQVVLEGLGVLGQADVVQPSLGHPVMVQVGRFG